MCCGGRQDYPSRSSASPSRIKAPSSLPVSSSPAPKRESPTPASPAPHRDRPKATSAVQEELSQAEASGGELTGAMLHHLEAELQSMRNQVTEAKSEAAEKAREMHK